MSIKIMKLSILSFLILFGFVGYVFAQIAQIVDCRATLEAWKFEARANQSLKNFLETHSCSCPSLNSSSVCTPTGSPGQQTTPRRQRGWQQQRQQELTDEQIIEMMERTKALTSQVQSEDKARVLAEHYAFLDRLSLLARDLQSLKAESMPQFWGLKLKLKDLAEQATTIKEMGNIARWSLEIARNAYFGESAREKAGWGFDEWGKSSGVMDFSQLTMEAPLPERKTPQYLAFKYIADWASDMYTKILRLSERRSEAEKKAWDLKNSKKYEPIPLTSNYAEEVKKREEQRADLEKQAQALLEEAKQMEERASEYVKEVSRMEKEFFELKNDPSKSSEFLDRHEQK